MNLSISSWNILRSSALKFNLIKKCPIIYDDIISKKSCPLKENNQTDEQAKIQCDENKQDATLISNEINEEEKETNLLYELDNDKNKRYSLMIKILTKANSDVFCLQEFDEYLLSKEFNNYLELNKIKNILFDYNVFHRKEKRICTLVKKELIVNRQPELYNIQYNIIKTYINKDDDLLKLYNNSKDFDKIIQNYIKHEEKIYNLWKENEKNWNELNIELTENEKNDEEWFITNKLFKIGHIQVIKDNIKFNIVNVHLYGGSYTDNEQNRKNEELIYLNKLKDIINNENIIICGDYNLDIYGNYTYIKPNENLQYTLNTFMKGYTITNSYQRSVKCKNDKIEDYKFKSSIDNISYFLNDKLNIKTKAFNKYENDNLLLDEKYKFTAYLYEKNNCVNSSYKTNEGTCYKLNPFWSSDHIMFTVNLNNEQKIELNNKPEIILIKKPLQENKNLNKGKYVPPHLKNIQTVFIVKSKNGSKRYIYQ